MFQKLRAYSGNRVINTVKPLYSEHLWDPNFCSFYRGVH